MESKIAEKNWSKELEKPIYEEWQRTRRYAFDPQSPLPVYSIDTPPPYVNTPIHIGHATTYALMDMFARFRRMIGFTVLFPLGLDRNGLPIEMAAEKKFNKKFNHVTREEFLDMCRAVLETSSTESIKSFLQLGISFNSWEHGKEIGDLYHTDSPDYRSLTQDTFIDLYKRDLIYEDERINNYCPGCRTTIADAEIDYADKETFFNDVIFTVKETGEKIIIGTTRPELIASCGMVIFHPDDEKYKHLDGKHAITPLYAKEVPLRAHPLARIDKGTGLVMMCSAGDTSDIRFFREMNLAPIISISVDGTMNHHAGFLQNLKVSHAREKMIETLQEKGLLVNQRKVTHRTPICERSKDPIEFISMKEFYLRQLAVKEKMLELGEKMNFYDQSSKQIYLDWVNSVSIDWPISRRRYYATEIPLWYCTQCHATIIPPKGKYYQPWKEQPPVERCACGSTSFRGEERVLDTWFDSSNSPLFILKYCRDPVFFEKNNRCSLRPQGKEIIRTWLYYTILKGYLLTGKCIFKDAWINYHIVDEHGKKMSKSVGNVIDPQIILEKYGAESFRLWAVLEGNLEKDDMKCSFQRIEGAAKTLTKIWNVARFVSLFPPVEGDIHYTDLDTWVTNEINKIAEEARAQYDKYDFHNPSIALRHFIWETFSSHYLEMVKNRAYNEKREFSKEEQNGALATLHYCLDVVLKLLAPIIPFITYKLYNALHEKDIHAEEFPRVAPQEEIPFTTEDIVRVNNAVWKVKKENNASLKAEVAELTIPEKLETITPDIIPTHSVKKISFGELKVTL